MASEGLTGGGIIKKGNNFLYGGGGCNGTRYLVFGSRGEAGRRGS